MQNIDTDKILADIKSTRLGIIGDFCLDAYWELDPDKSEISVETKLPTQAVVDQRYSLGGAGNVANNLKSLGINQVSVFGVTGDDPFGEKMRQLMKQEDMDLSGLLSQDKNWDTHVFIKPILEGHERPRIDFGNANQLNDQTVDALFKCLSEKISELDALIINQQVFCGIHNSAYFQKELKQLIADNSEKIFILDSRGYSDCYDGTIRKMNAYEAATLCGEDLEPDAIITEKNAKLAGQQLYAKWQKPLFITRGDRGCLVFQENSFEVIPGLHIIEKTDPVGAGDSMLSGIAVALATGYDAATAAAFGNYVAGVTVQKLFCTGTATPEEIKEIGVAPDYIFAPEKADDIRSAKYFENSEIEIVSEDISVSGLSHAIFDHDGTISVLREGWEKIMEPVMIKSILGPVYQDADETTYFRVVNRIKKFIDDTTGIQTLIQMQGLVKLVKEFGFVPQEDILDEFGYKEIYNQALLELVNERIAKLQRGELAADDFVIKGAVPLLHSLHQAGVKLYMASGSDENDVIKEAEVLGYADLFEGRIYGAVGDATKEAKRIVMDRIANDIGQENMTQVAAFGDGPVEIREIHKRGGLSVGIASDEVRRFGLNPAKRSRLIRAGADIIIPDFSQSKILLKILQVD